MSFYFMALLILFTDDFQFSTWPNSESYSLLFTHLSRTGRKLLDLHPYPNASASQARIHWFLLDNYIIDLTTWASKKAEDTICIKFAYICIHMPGQKIQQFTFPHHKRGNGTTLCSFGVPFTVLFFFFFFYRHLFHSQTFQVAPMPHD